MKSNKLTINCAKVNYMIINNHKAKTKPQPEINFKVMMETHKIEQTQSIIYVCLFIAAVYHALVYPY